MVPCPLRPRRRRPWPRAASRPQAARCVNWEKVAGASPSWWWPPTRMGRRTPCSHRHDTTAAADSASTSGRRDTRRGTAAVTPAPRCPHRPRRRRRLDQRRGSVCTRNLYRKQLCAELDPKHTKRLYRRHRNGHTCTGPDRHKHLGMAVRAPVAAAQRVVSAVCREDVNGCPLLLAMSLVDFDM